ncbi:hypothetical protein D3C76_1272810 [compost metagenome]
MQAVIHARARLALGLGRINGHLEEAAPAHHFGELAELGGGLGRFTQQLGFKQAGFQRGPCRKRLGDHIKIVGDALQQCRTLGERGMAVVVKGGVGKLCRPVHFDRATEGEIRFDQLMGGRVERFHCPCAGGDFVGAE